MRQHLYKNYDKVVQKDMKKALTLGSHVHDDIIQGGSYYAELRANLVEAPYTMSKCIASGRFSSSLEP